MPPTSEIIAGVQVAATLTSVLMSITLMKSLITILRPDITDAENRIQPVPFSEIKSSYDYILIGGGAAGCVLANRLTENDTCTVLMLEAGPDEPEVCDVPYAYNILQGTEADWQFKTESSNTSCLAMKDHRCSWPRGKALGGSTILNGMIYIRGNKKDYDTWEELGNPGWSYKSVFPYFKKSQDMRIDEFEGSPYHSTGGLQTVEYFKYRTPVVDYLMKAGPEMGYEVVDSNGPKQTGFMVSQSTVRDGLRCSTEKAFLRPASKRKNLHVSVNSLVEKILVREGEYSGFIFNLLFIHLFISDFLFPINLYCRILLHYVHSMEILEEILQNDRNVN
ncbi:glucose dehydrogenase [FAD, quinone]-like [Hylaeus anthracinus]|uniref:glucose dehydrogenase [FAD, quinone]-like n=1 Tax=Hylaeus anthracinus TaxID=313031 RepID=UPI0023B974BC|nr:glucose dehydrogenase [FAD, quinone]-like [Hylaeus anthracinus]